MGRLIECAEHKLGRSEEIEEPDLAGIADEQETEDDCHPAEIADDEQVAPVETVGQYACYGAEEKHRQQTGQKEIADCHT